MGKVLYFPDDPEREERLRKRQHELDVLVNADGHPTEIVCSCGKVFKAEEWEGAKD